MGCGASSVAVATGRGAPPPPAITPAPIATIRQTIRTDVPAVASGGGSDVPPTTAGQDLRKASYGILTQPTPVISSASTNSVVPEETVPICKKSDEKENTQKNEVHGQPVTSTTYDGDTEQAGKHDPAGKREKKTGAANEQRRQARRASIDETRHRRAAQKAADFASVLPSFPATSLVTSHDVSRRLSVYDEPPPVVVLPPRRSTMPAPACSRELSPARADGRRRRQPPQPPRLALSPSAPHNVSNTTSNNTFDEGRDSETESLVLGGSYGQISASFFANGVAGVTIALLSPHRVQASAGLGNSTDEAARLHCSAGGRPRPQPLTGVHSPREQMASPRNLRRSHSTTSVCSGSPQHAHSQRHAHSRHTEFHGGSSLQLLPTAASPHHIHRSLSLPSGQPSTSTWRDAFGSGSTSAAATHGPSTALHLSTNDRGAGLGGMYRTLSPSPSRRSVTFVDDDEAFCSPHNSLIIHHTPVTPVTPLITAAHSDDTGHEAADLSAGAPSPILSASEAEDQQRSPRRHLLFSAVGPSCATHRGSNLNANTAPSLWAGIATAGTATASSPTRSEIIPLQSSLLRDHAATALDRVLSGRAAALLPPPPPPPPPPHDAPIFLSRGSSSSSANSRRRLGFPASPSGPAPTLSQHPAPRGQGPSNPFHRQHIPSPAVARALSISGATSTSSSRSNSNSSSSAAQSDGGFPRPHHQPFHLSHNSSLLSQLYGGGGGGGSDFGSSGCMRLASYTRIPTHTSPTGPSLPPPPPPPPPATSTAIEVPPQSSPASESHHRAILIGPGSPRPADPPQTKKSNCPLAPSIQVVAVPSQPTEQHATAAAGTLPPTLGAPVATVTPCAPHNDAFPLPVGGGGSNTAATAGFHSVLSNSTTSTSMQSLEEGIEMCASIEISDGDDSSENERVAGQRQTSSPQRPDGSPAACPSAALTGGESRGPSLPAETTLEPPGDVGSDGPQPTQQTRRSSMSPRHRIRSAQAAASGTATSFFGASGSSPLTAHQSAVSIQFEPSPTAAGPMPLVVFPTAKSPASPTCPFPPPLVPPRGTTGAAVVEYGRRSGTSAPPPLPCAPRFPRGGSPVCLTVGRANHEHDIVYSTTSNGASPRGSFQGSGDFVGASRRASTQSSHSMSSAQTPFQNQGSAQVSPNAAGSALVARRSLRAPSPPSATLQHIASTSPNHQHEPLHNHDHSTDDQHRVVAEHDRDDDPFLAFIPRPLLGDKQPTSDGRADSTSLTDHPNTMGGTKRLSTVASSSTTTTNTTLSGAISPAFSFPHLGSAHHQATARPSHDGTDDVPPPLGALIAGAAMGLFGYSSGGLDASCGGETSSNTDRSLPTSGRGGLPALTAPAVPASLAHSNSVLGSSMLSSSASSHRRVPSILVCSTRRRFRSDACASGAASPTSFGALPVLPTFPQVNENMS